MAAAVPCHTQLTPLRAERVERKYMRHHYKAICQTPPQIIMRYMFILGYLHHFYASAATSMGREYVLHAFT